MPPLNLISANDRGLWKPEIHSNYAMDAVYQTRFLANRVKRLDSDALKKNTSIVIHDLTPHLTTNALGANMEITLQKIAANVAKINITEAREVSYGIEYLRDLQALENDQAIHAKAAGEAHAEYMEKFILLLESGIAAGNRAPVIGAVNIGPADIAGMGNRLDKSLVKARNRHWITTSGQHWALTTVENFSTVRWQGLGYQGQGMKKGELSDMILGFEPLYTTFIQSRTIDHTGDGGINGTYFPDLFWTDEAIGMAVQKSMFTKGPIPSEDRVADIYQTVSVFGGGIIRPPFIFALDHLNA